MCALRRRAHVQSVRFSTENERSASGLRVTKPRSWRNAKHGCVRAREWLEVFSVF